MNESSASKHDDQWRTMPLVSIIINNYNYAPYLAAAIDSALAQDYRNSEIIVVDDGSTDRSRGIIASYGSRLTAIYKQNGGQASALNAGFAASRGEIIIFLDADDLLLPNALNRFVEDFRDKAILNVHWAMWIIDAYGNRTGSTMPPQPPLDGNLRDRLIEFGPTNLPASPTSGNAWRRELLTRILPIPEGISYFRLCADEYLYTLAPAFGLVRTIREPQSCYRIHGNNVYSGRSMQEKLAIELAGYDEVCRALQNILSRNGITVDLHNWKRYSWFHCLDRALSDICATIPDGEQIVLVEGGTWDATGAFGSRAVRPFIEQEGLDWGPPADCECAIDQFEIIRQQGSQYFVIGWPAFWWFDAYPGFAKHLEQTANCLVRNDYVAIFRLDRRVALPLRAAVSQMVSK
jgi:glycosyltransferase involved in cell wall biosynthesis